MLWRTEASAGSAGASLLSSFWSGLASAGAASTLAGAMSRPTQSAAVCSRDFMAPYRQRKGVPMLGRWVPHRMCPKACLGALAGCGQIGSSGQGCCRFVVGQQAVDGRVRKLTLDAPALAQHPFAVEAQAVKHMCRGYVAWIDLGFDTVQVQGAEQIAQHLLQGLMHVALALAVRRQQIADLGPHGLAINGERNADA